MTSPADTLTRLLHATDLGDWPAVRDCFADTVRVDYSSLNGQPAGDIAADELIKAWQTVLPGFDATQHLTGPCVVNGDQVRTHVQAVHFLDNDVWRLYGHYLVQVIDDKITELSLRVLFQEGTIDLPQRAAERVAAR
jgi:hypothetical protein